MALRPGRCALLVGLDFYRTVGNDRRPKGSVNDIEYIQLYLEQIYSPIRITKLVAIDTGDPAQKTPTGSPQLWPTYENITGELKNITNLASPGDYIYFHYSGHGTLKPTTATEYRENDGSDAALVLFDISSPSGVRYLRGVELASLFDDMTRKDLKLMIVLDCCHSGSVLRQDKFCIRGVPWDDDVSSTFPIQLLGQQSNSYGKSRDSLADQHWLLKPEQYSLLAACGIHEIAQECRGRNGLMHGALSYLLFGVLSFSSRNGYTMALGSICQHIYAKFHLAFPEQHPVLLGNEGAIFMGPGNKTHTIRSTCDVVDVKQDGQTFILNIGHAHGIYLGDEFALSPVETIKGTESLECRVEAKVVVTVVNAFYSESVLSQSPRDEIKAGISWHATLSRPFRPKVQVKLSPEIDPEWILHVNASPMLQVVEALEATATLPSFRITTCDQNSNYSILTGGYNQIANITTVSRSNVNAVQHILRILEHLAKFAAIEGLENERSNSLRVGYPSIGLKTGNSGQNTLEGDFSVEFNCKDDPAKNLVGNMLHVDDGARLSITFTNHTDQPLYLTVLDMKPLRQVSKLYPPQDRFYYREVSPKYKDLNKDIIFPGHISFTIKMKIPDSLKAKGQLQVEDILKFFVTTQPTFRAFATLELPELLEPMSESHRGSEDLLVKFLEELGTKDMFPIVLRADDSSKERWGCQNFTIQTRL